MGESFRWNSWRVRLRQRVANQRNNAHRKAHSLSKITWDTDSLSEVIVNLIHGCVLKELRSHCCCSSLVALAELEGSHRFAALLGVFLREVDGGLHELAQLWADGRGRGAVMLSVVDRIHHRASLS